MNRTHPCKLCPDFLLWIATQYCQIKQSSIHSVLRGWYPDRVWVSPSFTLENLIELSIISLKPMPMHGFLSLPQVASRKPRKEKAMWSVTSWSSQENVTLCAFPAHLVVLTWGSQHLYGRISIADAPWESSATEPCVGSLSLINRAVMPRRTE